MARGGLLSDRLVAGGFVRPSVLLRGLLLRRRALSCWRVSLAMGLRWPLAQAPLQARIDRARSYTADPVKLPLAAEQRLNDLMEEA